MKKKIVVVDCVAFEDDDILAEQKIFGYSKGAFKGATKKEDGYLHKAGGRIIVFDDITKLSKNMQSRLMQALNTDKENYFRVRRMRERRYEKIKCTVIFTTSNTVNKLRENLLPELFDRIMQLVIELPSLRETPEEIPAAFEDVWKQLLFDEKKYPYSNITSDFMNWLEKLPLYGNYRDLQRIAIFYKSYLDFSKYLKELVTEKNAFDFTKSQYKKYIFENNNDTNKYFRTDRTTKSIITDFRFDLANWLVSKHGSAQKIKNFLKKELNEEISIKTISNWKNKKY